MPFLEKNVTKSQCKDAGLALVLILLLLALTTWQRYLLPAGIVLLIVTMTAPGLYKPFARFWFGLSHTLGTMISRVLLTVLFYLLVTPMGLLRRLLGKDAMQLKSWKKDRTSVFQSRDHMFTSQDLDQPY